MEYEEIKKKLRKIQPGERVVYYVGHLARDIAMCLEGSSGRDELDSLRFEAWLLYENSKHKKRANLFQSPTIMEKTRSDGEKYSERAYEYIAIGV